MKTYENCYFGLRFDFPDRWKLMSWRHTKTARSRLSAYQSKDDDLPKTATSASKFLFTAALHPPESEAVVDAEIELSVFRLSPNMDMRESLVENIERQRAFYQSNGIVTSITSEGVWAVGSVDFTYVDQESTTRSGHCWHRFFFRSVHDALWLYGKIAGHKQQAYQEALEIVAGAISTAKNIG